LCQGDGRIATNPFDDFFNYGEWSYSGDEQVAFYSLEKLISISVWEPDPANAGEVNWLAPDHLTLWGLTSAVSSISGGPDSPGIPVPEPSAALLFALGSMISMARVRSSSTRDWPDPEIASGDSLR
jgi:hypothetical protein